MTAPVGTAAGAASLTANQAGPLAAPSRRRWVTGALAAIAIVAVAVVAAIWLLTVRDRAPAVTSSLDPEKVVVAVFDNRTGDPKLDSLGLMISDVIGQNLTRLQDVKIALNPLVSAMGSEDLPRPVLAAGGDPLRRLAERTGAGLVVSGAYYLDGENIRVQSQLILAETRAVATSFDPEFGPRAKPSDVIAHCQKASLRSGSLGAVLWDAAHELEAHCYEPESVATAKRAAEWYKNRIETGKPTNALRSSYAAMLYRAGDCRQALQIRTDLMKAAPDNLSYQASYAMALVNCGGSRAEAQKIADALAKVDRPFLRGTHHYHRARVLAVLGDREGAVRALEAACGQGYAWDGETMHLELAFRSLRDLSAGQCAFKVVRVR